MIEAIVIGTSAGGLEALQYLLPCLTAKTNIPVFVVQHVSHTSDSYFIRVLKKISHLRVKEPCSTEEIEGGTIYISPPDYHLMIESDFTMTLSCDEKVNYCRPSIDVLFRSASEVYREKLMGILLTGSNKDGSQGLLDIHQLGGTTIVEDPKSAFMGAMPESAIRLFKPDRVLQLKEIGKLLQNLSHH